MNLPLSVKAGQLMLITLFCTFIFYNIYNKVLGRDNFDAIYMASMNQTLNGGGMRPRSNTEKIVIAVQCILAFFISTGLLIINFKF